MPPVNPTLQPTQANLEKQYIEDYYVYSLAEVVVAFGAQAQANIQIQADSLFRWDRAVYYATIADAAFVANTQPIPNVTVQIVDSGTGRQLFSLPQPIPSVFGRGELPFLLPQPRMFKPNSTITFQFANFDAAVTYRLRLGLIGAKIFELSNFRGL